MGAASLALTGTVALIVPPAVTPALVAGVHTVLAEAKLLSDEETPLTEAWIIGGSGMPIPPQSYMDAVTERFVDPTQPFFHGQPQFPVSAANPLFTPEGLYPVTGIKTLPLDPSVAQGLSILNSTITNQIADGHNLVVQAYSQSSAISSLEMRDLLALPADQQPTADQLSFVLLGDPSNPDGGVLERFGDPSLPPLSFPSLGLTFSGATPSDTPWSTAIYTLEYDGFADFPKYPINFLSDLNAVAGIHFVHTTYSTLSDAQMASAIELPLSDDLDGDTQYFMIPTENLPLLDPLRDIPVVGNPLADLLQPDLRVLINLGYGPDPDIGWSTTGANVPTPFGLFPDFTSAQFNTVLQDLATGAQTGVTDFMTDLSHPAAGSVSILAGPSFPADPASFADIVNAFSSVVASAYATLLPTADVVNAVLTSLPAYDVSLFVHEFAAGDLLNAVGLPIAASTGLVALAAGFEIEAIASAVSEISQAFSGL